MMTSTEIQEGSRSKQRPNEFICTSCKRKQFDDDNDGGDGDDATRKRLKLEAKPDGDLALGCPKIASTKEYMENEKDIKKVAFNESAEGELRESICEKNK
jgi:hypothetical protein